MTFSLTVLGSSSALPTSERFTTAQVLNVHERFFLIDCGEGTQIQLRKYKIKFSKINHIFISHTHGDHILGLIGLISSFNLLGRVHTLNIYAPGNIKEILECQLKIFVDELQFPIEIHQVGTRGGSLLYEDEHLSVQAFPVKHRIQTVGYLFKEKQKLPNIKKDMINFYKISIKEIHKIKEGADYTTEDGEIIENEKLVKPPPEPKSYAFCTDTAYNEKIIPFIKDVDLLYHEATFMKDMEKRAKTTLHSTAEQAAKMAKLSGAKQLLIGHFSVRYKDISPLLNEAQEIFPNTICAEDGMKIDL